MLIMLYYPDCLVLAVRVGRLGSIAYEIMGTYQHMVVEVTMEKGENDEFQGWIANKDHFIMTEAVLAGSGVRSKNLVESKSGFKLSSMVALY